MDRIDREPIRGYLCCSGNPFSAFYLPSSSVVGERRRFSEAAGIIPGGGSSSEDAGMSNEKTGENPVRR
jgi:hypothetical protein